MYSVVLMAAMTATAETPSLGNVWAKHCFWEACWPARYGAMTCGPEYRPYYPASYHSCCGCYGSSHHWPVVHNYSCHGSHLGWQAGWTTSCLGNNTHTYGYHNGCGGCGGCYGGFGGCYGGGSHYTGCSGGYYSCYGGGSMGGLYNGIGYAGFGGYGNFGMYNTIPVYAAPVYATPLFEARPVETRPNIQTKPIETRPIEIKPIEIKPLKTSNSVDSKATIVVRVPADAKVFINGYQMKSTSTERVFTSPNLEPNGSYYYTVRVVGEKGGKAIDESQRVSIRAGQTSQVAFDALPSPYRDDRTVTVIEPTKAPIK